MGGKSASFDKITFSEFCDKYLEQKKTSLFLPERSIHLYATD